MLPQHDPLFMQAFADNEVGVVEEKKQDGIKKFILLSKWTNIFYSSYNLQT